MKKREKGSIKALGKVLQYMLSSYKWLCLLALLCVLGSAVVGIRASLFMRTLIDDYILPLTRQDNPDFAPLGRELMNLAMVMALGALCAYAYNRIMVNVCQGTMKKLRIELFTRMEKLPIRYFDTHAHGDIMSVYTNDVDTLRQLMGQSLPQLANSALTVIMAFVSMLTLSAPLAVVSVLMIVLMMKITAALGGKSAGYFGAQQNNLGQVNGYIEEMMEGQKVVKVFCHEEKSVEKFAGLNEELRQSAKKANGIANILMPISGNLGNISYVLCAIAGSLIALNVKEGIFAMSLGTLVSFLTMNRSFTQPVTQMTQQINSVIMAMAGAERVFALMEQEPEEDAGYVELVNVKEEEDGSLTETTGHTHIWAWKHPHKADGSVTYTRLKGDITLNRVDFGYTEEKMVLHDVELFAQPGQKIAFVGGTGAGKTTITNLINRFYDIQDGKIHYDGININKIKKSDLRRSLGMVLQDTHLFTGTVMDNIRYGRLDATDDECREAARLANADGFIRRLPEGYDTMLRGDGGNLSQGQRQLLAIARAAVADPPALILDEATSSIDTRTEQLVQRGMDALMKGRTTFVIAHRLSTVKNADCIMVLEQGRIIERGTHEELMQLGGKYYQLYTGSAAHA